MEISIPTNLTLVLIVRDRAGVIFEGEVDAVSSYNESGPFDVLPLHTNFISLIQKMLSIHRKEKVLQRVRVGSGVLSVHENKVEVYLGILH